MLLFFTTQGAHTSSSESQSESSHELTSSKCLLPVAAAARAASVACSDRTYVDLHFSFRVSAVSYEEPESQLEGGCPRCRERQQRQRQRQRQPTGPGGATRSVACHIVATTKAFSALEGIIIGTVLLLILGAVLLVVNGCSAYGSSAGACTLCPRL